MKALIAFVAALLAAPLAAGAQPVNVGALDDDTEVATVTAGAEHGLVLGAGYGRVVRLGDRPVVVAGDVTLGWAEVDLGDYRLRAGALAPLAGGRRWRLLAGLTAVIRGTDNDLGELTSVGADVALLAGRYAPRGFVAAELGYDWVAATHVEHGDAYRMLVHPDARDGWYASPAGTLRAGVQGGLSLGRVDVILRAGRLVDASGDPPMFPIYGTLTVNTRW